MKIIIAGAGAVGTHLAKLFSLENHDITLIDEDMGRLMDIGNDFDILTLNDDPSSIHVIHDAGARNADLFIAVTPDEAHNLTICMLAKQLGAKQTVARVNNHEYALESNRELFSQTGVDSIIYPEMAAGKEIMDNIRRSWTRQWIPMLNDQLVLLCIKVRTGARILNVPLRDISKPDSPYHVVAIKRKEDTIIPHGNDCLLDQDVVYFMTTELEASYIKEIAGKQDYPDVRNVFFLGGGNTTERALAFLPDYMHAKVFESDPRRIEHLQSLYEDNRIMCINEDGRNIDLLEEEGIHRAQAFVATTSSSSENVLSCLNAKKLGVRKTVALIDNSNYVTMAQSLDIGSIIDKKTLAADKIYNRILQSDVTNVKSLIIAAADVAELVVKEGSRATRHPVRDLNLPSTVTLGGMMRNGVGSLINGMTQLQAGDTVMAFCIEGSINKLGKYFN